MVKAGAGTDAVIDALVDVFEPGDIIVDGGNALFTDTIRREKAVRETGINFVGAGISGGEEGALLGPSIMPGGSDESWVTLGPILKSIAAIAEGEPCVTHVGHDGAGHFVKMVHNGIEYADMQLIAEAYDLIRRGTGKTPAEIADVFAEWNKGELESYLIEITAEVLRQVDAATGKPLVDVILDQAGAKGTGAWTVQTALNLGVPVSGIAEAVFARSLSSPPGAARRLGRTCPARSRRSRSRTRTRSSRTSAWRCMRRRSSRTRRASTRSAPARPSTTGTSTSARSRRSGAAAASSAPSSSTASPTPTAKPPTCRCCSPPRTSSRPSAARRDRWRRIVPDRRGSRHPRPGVLVVAVVLRRPPRRAPARRPRAGPARLLRRAHLQAHRQARHLPHPVVGRPHRDRSRRHALTGRLTHVLPI